MEGVPTTVASPETDLLIEAVRVLIDGTGWSMTVGEPWAHVAPEMHALPDQGWKLHVSATEDSAADVLVAVVPLLLAEGATFKFAAGLRFVRILNSGGADRASSGKFLTVYPNDDDQARRIAAAAHAATAGMDGPAILTDRPYRPGSLVHYRYGGFAGRSAIDGDGLVVHLLQAPDGELVPDERRPGHVAPPWAVDPFRPPPDPAATDAPPGPRQVLLNDRFVVTGVLAQANKGGTYLATDRHTGATVVVKEGRPHVATTTAGDARQAIRHEARMLELAAPLGRTPRLVDLFEQGGHTFLVEEHIDADGLRDLVDPAYEPPGSGLPATTVRALALALADAVASFHAAGIVLRDLTPNNVLVTDAGGVVLVDLELAHPAGEAPATAAGTPGYAAPGQLAGEPAGFRDDYWSLGATIAYLATGADPYLPADVAHSWTDPGRLAAWLDDHVAAKALTPVLAAVVASTMDPDPARRLTPAGVVQALAGGLQRPATAPSDPPDAAAMAGSVAHWLCHRLGAGTAGHLWPTGPTGRPLDPVNVQSGASGVGLFLARAAVVMDGDHAIRRALATTATWVSKQVSDGPARPPGLYFGLSGVAWFLTEAGTVLDRDDLTRRANELALALPVLTENPDLSHGTAGIGMGQLHQWLRTGDDRFLARAALAAEHLVRTAERAGDGIVWPVPSGIPSRLAGTTSYGYAHGTAGIATFLLCAAAASGEEEFAAVAVEAADGLLALGQDGAGGSAWWPAGPEDPTCWPHWCNGSSGVGTALLRAHVWTGQRRYLNAAVAAARAGLMERWRSSTVQCHGLAGDAELLLDLAAVTGDDGYRTQARQAAAALWLRRRADRELVAFPDDTGGAVSAGFGTGMAGVGAFFLRLAAGGARPFMLDELLPRSRGGRSRRFRSTV